MSYEYGSWKPYVPVAKRRAQAEREIKKRAKGGTALQPVRIAGRAIAKSFWGQGWCRHLETFSDFENRLPRGRSYVRSGAVYHLQIAAGRVDAHVMGSDDYRVSVDIAALKPAAWKALKQRCAGGIGSLLELLQGRLSEQVMGIVSDRDSGLFPKPGEMKFSCNCPDWATMCKHVAATLYGVGNRLDAQPELLFRLRGVDPTKLIEAGTAAPLTRGPASRDDLAEHQLGAIFGIELDADVEAAPTVSNAPKPPRKAASKRKTNPPSATVGTDSPRFRASGKSVAALRKKLDLSITDFAARLSVSTASVQRWESAGTTRLNLHARSLAALNRLHRKAGVR